MKDNVKKLTLSALFLAVGLILPMAFHPFGPNAGAMFLPMHIPVLLCGFLCGSLYGAMVGVLTPLLSSMLTGMPMMMPTGIAMMFELMTYGIVSGFLMKKFHVYPSLLLAMIAGRAVSGIANMLLLGFMGKAYSLSIFLGAAFVTALPGILIQLIVIPLLIRVVTKIQQRVEN